MALYFRLGFHSNALCRLRSCPTTNNYEKILVQNITSITFKKLQEAKWETPQGFETDIFIYNPLQKNKTSKLVLQNENLIKWYSCGPTVYDSAHIGHASCYVKLDIIRRILLNFFNLDVFYLMGVTDIDDKIINRSNEAKTSFKSLAKQYEAEFFSDLKLLNVLSPTMTVRVSDHIPEIVSFVNTLVNKSLAYQANSGSVYFSVKDFSRYGKLCPPILSDSPEKPNPEKRSPLDFTLWKAAKPGEPTWESPWGAGRPGWHIECSAMASKVLGERMDIHSGGQDLLFPHHENEEAQSCAFHGCNQWVNYWIHTGHLIVKGDVKMSKSLKNTISISELLSSHTSNHFRMLCLLSPYRNNIEYSEETMMTAKGTFRKVESFLDECELYISSVKQTGCIDEPALLKLIQSTRTAIRNHLSDDFNTCKAMEQILHLMSNVTRMISQPLYDSSSRSTLAVATAADFVRKTLSQFGFTFSTVSGDEGPSSKCLSRVLDAAVELRKSVREVAVDQEVPKPQRTRLFQACDSLRDSLSSTGVELKDHGAQKTTWSIKDTASSNPDR